jgi:enoyl-CoA hydratase
VVALEQCPQPIIGAVNGAAVTGGFELALACDYLFASERARFADTHARVGILPGWGLSQKLSRIVGINRAREMSLTGNFIDAQRAEAWGLVNRVCVAESLLDEALASAAQIADGDPRAVFALKALMNDGVKENLGDALVLEGERGNAFAKTVDYSQMSARLAALRQRAAKQ